MSYTDGGPPDEPRSDGSPREALFHPEVDDIFEYMSNYQRRAILFLLKDGEIDTIEDVLRHHGADTGISEIELLHQHLPKLQDANYIQFDQESGALSQGPRFDQVAPLLELVEQHAEELPADWP